MFSVKIFNHSGGSDFHFWPVSFDTGGGVQKDDNFNWARYFWDGGNITAASAGTFGQVHATGRSDRPDLVVSVLLGDDQGRRERNESYGETWVKKMIQCLVMVNRKWANCGPKI